MKVRISKKGRVYLLRTAILIPENKWQGWEEKIWEEVESHRRYWKSRRTRYGDPFWEIKGKYLEIAAYWRSRMKRW